MVPADGPAIAIRDLAKSYGQVPAVRGVTFDVQRGEIFGFLGLNGAGKTTTIRILLDLLRPSRGQAQLFGFDCQRQSRLARATVGYMPGELGFYSDTTGLEVLDLMARLSGGVDDSARRLQLADRLELARADLRRPLRAYSTGMKRKLGLIQALMTEPRVLILDEPTSGLDPLMIEAFSETLDELARSGRTTVFLSSHILSEVDRICQRIGLVRGGQLVAVRTLSELRAAAPRRMTVRFSAPVNGDLPMLPGATLVTREPMQWLLDVQGPLGEIIPRLGHLPVADVQLAAFTLDEAILRLLGHVHKDRHVQKDVPDKAGTP